MKISSNVIGNSNDENNVLKKLFLTNTQLSRLCEAFASNSSANVQLSKTKFHKLEQSGGFLGCLLRPLLKTGLSLIANITKPLAKSILIPL